jgi:hypothetical protein
MCARQAGRPMAAGDVHRDYSSAEVMRDRDEEPVAARPGSDADPGEALARRRARRREAQQRRETRRRRGLVGLLALAALIGIVVALSSRGSASRRTEVVAGGTSTARRAAQVARHAGPSNTAAHPAAQAQTSLSPVVAALASAGSLPQTNVVPSADGAQFKALMALLWAGILADSPKTALPAFFPKRAYMQLKSIAGAESDWSGRLVRDYGLDIAAAHSLLAADASSAELVRVDVQSSYAHWVPPGVCDNGIGYYEMPGARIVYRRHGELRSFGIASMISWRGVWYVVHLGAVLRPEETGVVDEPSSGPGTPAYSGTC